ncbi:MAG: imidazole glycerol phosphate synthase subunit HisH [Dehalococcoidia bacterium]|nr:imidazole glycerol phosphate synthase subunit HisH [Dehalococcoidia bacterium]
MHATPKIAIINYGAGNLRSVEKAFEKIGHPALVTADAQVVAAADAVVLPGVGAARGTVDGLAARRLVDVIARTIARGTPFFGVCIGMQVLFQRSEEGHADCLGTLAGTVRKLPPGQKVPHMGWNQVEFAGSHPLFSGIPNRSNFYFVHSYYADPQDAAIVAGWTDYGIRFCSVAARGSLVATQFHPEKSGGVGLQIYANFVREVVGAATSPRHAV